MRPAIAPRMVRLKDVAADAGVSVATASMVLNQPHAVDQIGAACARRVRAAAERLGYVPNYHAQGMRGARTCIVGVAVEFASSGGFPNHLALGYFGTLIGSIDESLRLAHHSMLIINGMQGLSAVQTGVQAVRRRQIDGLIVVGRTSEMDLDTVAHSAAGLPIVAVEYRRRTAIPVIDFGERGGLDLAVAHLAELGHRDLLWVGPAREGRSGTPENREHLFLQSISKHGLRASSCRFAGLSTAVDFDEGIVDAATTALAAHLQKRATPPFTAIVCYNDAAAMGVYGVLRSRGLRTPADVSVVGFDDIQARLLVPKLTSISHMLPEMGTRALQVVLEMIDNPDAIARRRGERETIAARLVVRASTATPRRAIAGRGAP